MAPKSSETSGFLAAGILIVGIAAVALLTWWLPQAAAARRASNERNASLFLKSLTTAQAEFRAKDLEGNKVHDFWTGDVASLRRYGLISLELADADPRPLVPRPGGPLPFHGYFFVAVAWDHSETPPIDLRQNTDGKSGKVHHPERFSLCAYPAQFGVTGRTTFIINEENTMYWRHHGGDPIEHWPTDEEMLHDWGKGD